MEIEILNKDTFITNLPKIIDLYRVCFNRGLNEESFKWRYIDNPVNDLLFVVAKEDDNIIASYSASPCLIAEKNNIYHTALSLNTMTHPEYEGKGLFVLLANRLYEYMRQRDYKMIWGFPNNLSNRIFNDKLGWNTIYEIPTMTCSMNNIDTIEENNNLIEDPLFNLDYSNLENHNIKDICVKKYTSYLKWRYSNNPDNKYLPMAIKRKDKVDAYIVIKEYNDLLNIIDINFREINDVKIMINEIIVYAKKEKKQKVTIWAPINTKLHSYLEKKGFYNDYPVRYLGGKVLSQTKEHQNLLFYNNWFIHAGDNNEY